MVIKEFFAGRIRSVGWALAGVRVLVGSQRNAWIHFVATVLVVGAGGWWGITRTEWCAVVLAMMGVWMGEALNTAVEAVCDKVMPERHPGVKKAKDVAAGGVLISALGAVVVGVVVFGPRVWGGIG